MNLKKEGMQYVRTLTRFGAVPFLKWALMFTSHRVYFEGQEAP